ncbi:Probable polyol transporter 6 [Linum perenne]
MFAGEEGNLRDPTPDSRWKRPTMDHTTQHRVHKLCGRSLRGVSIARKCLVTAAFFAGIALNFVGRKAVILMGICFYVVGALVSSIGWNYVTVKIGHMTVGLSIGIELTSGPIYVAKIAPTVHRGLLVSFSQVNIFITKLVLYTFGMLLGYMVQFIAKTQLSTHSGGRLQIAVGAIPSLFLLLIFGIDRSCFVESPCWLVIRGKLAHAATIMERCGAKQDEPEYRMDQLRYLAGISPALVGDDEVQVTSVSVIMRTMWDKLLFPTYAFLGTLGFVATLLSFQSFSGADVALGLVVTYLLDFGDYAPLTFLSGCLICSLVRMATSVIPLLIVDGKGRRWIILLSIGFTS